MQSSKDSKGGKSHAERKSDTGRGGGAAKAKGGKKENPGSPTGSQKKGERKTTP